MKTTGNGLLTNVRRRFTIYPEYDPRLRICHVTCSQTKLTLNKMTK